MGWEIHITRAEHWAESDKYPIAVGEWLMLVGSDPDLIIDPRGNCPYFALWLSHHVDGDHPWFDWFAGAVCTKYPDRKVLSKALEIAGRLGARVQEDDGEFYQRPEDLAG